MVLGISSNSRVIGLAVIESGSLIDFKAQLHKERWSASKSDRMVASIHSCVSEYSITRIALVTPYAYHTTLQTKAIVRAVTSYCKKQGIVLSVYDQSALYSLCASARAKKKALMQAMSERYPELTYISRKESKHKHKYYTKLFEAVGVATLCVHNVDN